MGGGIGMGNTCKPMAVLFQCMTKFTTKKKKNVSPAWPALAGRFFTTELPGKPLGYVGVCMYCFLHQEHSFYKLLCGAHTQKKRRHRFIELMLLNHGVGGLLSLFTARRSN